MPKGKGNEATVQKTSKGQYYVTIPRAIAGMLEIEKGDKFEWVHHSRGLLLRKLKENLNAKER